ncbi:unnamed protein product [Darwinula stevensoni]|uniref:ZP domain-containing protein n=1 Tax=Darwinula stevensoni TaxID=69355 RepID=A0A7R8XDM0_9CRUS|nr:unnamed protein product [Darwinula stevensoni]CAG0893635.1 unnamed protein product [Darwinula stevensoni]
MACGQLQLPELTNDLLPANMPQIRNLDVECAKTGMTVNIEFSTPFNGVIFSKGFYSNPACR